MYATLNSVLQPGDGLISMKLALLTRESLCAKINSLAFNAIKI